MVVLPALVLSGLASFFTKSTFKKYSQVPVSTGMTGAQAADAMLRSVGLGHIQINQSQGFLSDHYNPADRTLNLSPDVYNRASLSAVGVACHEAGHAIQHAHHYKPLAMRSALVPVTNVCSNLAWLMMITGAFMFRALVIPGAVLFFVTFLFSVVTLPVEWNASARAKKAMVNSGIVRRDEVQDAGNVLNAAFLTYLAAAVSALLTLLWFLMRAGLLGNDE
jgi:Zn-dependent membrane protease YugP